MVFMDEDDNKPVSEATIKESKDILHRLIRQQAIDSREDYTAAVFAINRVTPYRTSDPEVENILKVMERTFPTLPAFGEL
jgi:hypothetical protein